MDFTGAFHMPDNERSAAVVEILMVRIRNMLGADDELSREIEREILHMIDELVQTWM